MRAGRHVAGAPLAAALGAGNCFRQLVARNKDHGWLAKWEKVEKNSGMQGL